MSCEVTPQSELLEELRRLQTTLQEKEKLQLELERNARCYKGLFDLAADAILLGDALGNIINANHSATLLTGYAHEELFGLNISRLFAESEHARSPLRYDLLKAGKVVHHERMLTRKDGTTVAISMNSKRMPDGTYHSFIRDISERIRAEQALKERESTLSSILRAAPIGIGTTHNRVITWASETLLDMLGYTAPELLGQNARILYESDEEFEQVGERKYNDIAERKIGVVESRWKLKDGKVIDVLLSSTPLDPLDLSHGITFTALDITGRKAAEEKQREMVRMKSEFIAIASHELRTPLAVAMGYLELLQNNQGFGAQEKQEFLSCIFEKVQVLEKLIDELLDISRIESGRLIGLERTPVRIAEAVRSVVRQFHKESSRHHFSLSFVDENIELLIDKWKFAQVMENLVDNAVKFSPGGGEILIRGEVVDGGYQLSIGDQGIGMDAEQQKRVFEKFYRADNSNTAASGLGIGLFLAKNIIEAHRGTIGLESRPGEGTLFFLRLPLEFNSLHDGGEWP